MAKSSLCGAVLCVLVATACAGKWPLRAPHSDDVPASFDCAMRKLAYQYGQQLLPRYSKFEPLYNALGLNVDCKSAGDEDLHFVDADRTPTKSSTEITTDEEHTVYVATSGSDSASGTIDNPLKTLGAAVAKAASITGPVTVVLRGGIYYLAQTVQITPANNGLKIQNYKDENVTISGGKVVSVDWKPYNVTPSPPPPPSGWVTQDNYNYVWDSPIGKSGFPLLGKLQSKEDCQAACQAHPDCHAYTWHDKKTGPYSLDCVGRTDGRYEVHPQPDHFSGHDASATPLGPSPSPPAMPNNMYVADVSGQGFSDMPGLQINGVRATRARYPNGNVETTVPDNRISGSQANWAPPDLSKQGQQKYIVVTDPALRRNFTDFGFQEYMVGIGGPCDIYDPPISYWCSKDPSGGGAFAFRAPSGLIPSHATTLPNAPYKDTSRMIVNVWRPSRWANWMFEVDDYDASINNITFGKGGFQGARGNNKGSDFFIENVFEEFDYQNEYFYDAKAEKLYFFYNGTGAPPASLRVESPQLKTLLNFTSSQYNPIKGVTVSGITFTQAAYTYMDPHGVPSGGDWALDRFGAIFLQGTESVVFDQCLFTRLDGNAVMVSGYNRNATVSNSEFSWIGGNAMAGWGFTNETTEQGIFGTDGNHPKYTTIISNLVHEVGHYEKQSSFWFQAKTAASQIVGNVMFNGPRAGINFNDGFGGGDVISNCLVFSTCRESGDHGPFNSWDRQPFVTDVRTGSPSIQMAWREIRHSFFIDNYSPQEDIDNDDGSCYYHTHDNFLVYGGRGMKNDFGGHDNWHYNNVYGYVGSGLGICSQIDGHPDAFFNNSLVMTGSKVGTFTCDGKGKTIVHDNHVFTQDGKAEECNHSPPRSPGTTVAQWPSDDVVMGWAKQRLGMS